MRREVEAERPWRGRIMQVEDKRNRIWDERRNHTFIAASRPGE
jgi:hypothetical protein